jgi:Uma2 family endonuclease
MINLVVKPDTLQLPAGSIVRIPATWEDYRALSRLSGDSASPRLRYRPGELKLMVPLPEHGKELDVVVDIVKVLLRYHSLPFDSYHETTIELPGRGGIIPDHFFYIGELPVVGKRRIDWSSEPPPDLALELDITSFTDIEDYAPYRIGEVWIIRQGRIAIYRWTGERYELVEESRFFPGLNLNTIVTECIEEAYRFGSSAIDRLSDRFPPRR